MIEIKDSDWEELQRLAERGAVAEERVSVARLRSGSQDRKHGPLTLLVGRPENGMDLLFNKWLGSEAANALRQARGRPLVVAPRSSTVAPRQGSWPSFRYDKLEGYSIIAVRTPTYLPNDVLAQIASLGTIEQVVFVTRLSQPLPNNERELIAPLAGLAEIARALVVSLPAEKPQPNDIGEVKQFVIQRLHNEGFKGRVTDVGVWLTAGSAPQTVERLETFLAPAESSPQARIGAVRTTFGGLLAEVAKRSKSADLPQPLPVDAEELQRIDSDMVGYLTVLGETVQRRFATVNARPEEVRAFVLEQITSWQKPLTGAGIWLEHLEKLRPGAGVGLTTAAAESSATLGFEPPPDSPAVAPLFRWLPPTHFSPLVYRFGLALVAGSAAYGAMILLLPPTFFARDLVIGLGIMVGTIGGYSLAPRLEPQAAPSVKQPLALRQGLVTNWSAFQYALQTWLKTHIKAYAASLSDRCSRLALRLEIPIDD